MTYLLYVLAFVAFVFGMSLLYRPKLHMTRWHGANFLVAGLVISFGTALPSIIMAAKNDHDVARQAGFASGAEMREAQAAGFSSRDDWRAHLATEARRKCRPDLNCWANRHITYASSRYAKSIELASPYKLEWTDSAIEPKFRRWRWKDEKAGVVTYIGDRVRMLDRSGEWQPYVYTCDYDTDDHDAAFGRVLAFGASTGQLPR